MAKVTCPLMDLPITSPYLGREYTECEQWRDQIVARLQAERLRLIVVSMSRRYGADLGFSDCPLVIGDNLVFRDDNHVTADYAETLAPIIGTLTDHALSRN